MKREIILMALTAPHAYPWTKKFGGNIEEINRVLEQNRLAKEEERRIAGWKLAIVVYKAGKKTKSILEFKQLILDYCREESYIDDEVIEEYLKIKCLLKEDAIITLNKFMNNILTDEEKRKNKNNITYWLLDLAGFDVAGQPIQDNMSERITNRVMEIVNEYFYMYRKPEWIKEIQRRKALHREEVIELLSRYVRDRQEDVTNLLEYYRGEKKDNIIETSISKNAESTILDLFDVLGMGEEDGELVAEEVSIVADKQEEVMVMEEKQVIEEVDAIKEVVPQNENITQYLGLLANELGYELHKKGDYVLSATEYEVMMQERKSAEVKIFKQMAKLEEGAILSELYNAYSNIKNTSVANLEAILSNFFMMLETAGLEVIEEGIQVGKEVTVNTADVLKEFIFSKPHDKDGMVQGTLLYKGWSYKGEQVIPKVVMPKMMEGEK